MQGLKLINFDNKNNKYQLRILSLISSILSNGLDDSLKAQFKDAKLPHYLASVLNEDSNTSLVDKSLNIVSQLNQLNYEFSLEKNMK